MKIGKQTRDVAKLTRSPNLLRHKSIKKDQQFY